MKLPLLLFFSQTHFSVHFSIRALPADEWRRAPYLGGTSDSFWRKAEAFVPKTEIPKEPPSLVPEVPHEEADLIPLSSVLRFRVERGDIPYCFVNYEAVSQTPAHWGDWVESVLSSPDSVHALRASQALEPIRLLAELSIRKNNANVDLMVSWWSKDTHTFVFPWRDGGPTLQDTAVLIRLSTRGPVAFDPSNLSPADARLVDRLSRAYTTAGKCGPLRSRAKRLGAIGFLVYWLSFFVIPDVPYEGPNRTVFPLATEGIDVSASALTAFAAACPCSLPALCAKGTRSMLYRPDRVARQAHVKELAEGYNVVVLPINDRETFFTANGRFAWRRNLDSFINYVRGAPEVPAFLDVYHRDVSLRSPKARQPGWRGKKSYWALSSTTPAASRGITIAEPISTVIPPRVTRGVPTRAAGIPRSEEAPASVASAGSSFWYEGGEHTPLSKPKRKREGEEAREEGSDSIDDTVPISKSFKLPRAAQPNPGGTSAAAGKKVVVALDEGESDGDDSDTKGSDDRNGEEGDDSDADGGEGDQSDEDGDDEDHSGDDNSGEDLGDNEGGDDVGDDNDDANGNDGDDNEGRDGGGGDGGSLGVDIVHPMVKEDEEDDDASGLIPPRRIPTEGLLSVLNINQLAPEAAIPQLSRRETVETALDLFDKRVNVPPTGDLATHFQAHDAAVALTNLTSTEVFADLQDNSFISLGTPQAGYTAGDVGGCSSLLARGSVLQQQVEASTSRGHVAADDNFEVQVVEPPVVNEVEELSNEAFFGYYGFTRESLKDIRVCDLGLDRIEEIGLTVQNFDKLGFDIWWVYKELNAAKIMRENDLRWRLCEGAKAALEEAHIALARAQDAVAAAEAVVEERRLVYERLAEEARLGDRLIDVPLCNTNLSEENLWLIALFILSIVI
ncbi:hypothetical protein RHGRI_000828 [Rhododendron griersonianum]|uniref:Aminotransferase-like plant mobile domain-containing protein n=1 Tax=Rhododendron griersonianum TaxID=479676 RepID=A0AAV6LKJ3_9ERIC|nr:hypothetical protein RHGRI_000828 [Rhododendron griersonianum]